VRYAGGEEVGTKESKESGETKEYKETKDDENRVNDENTKGNPAAALRGCGRKEKGIQRNQRMYYKFVGEPSTSHSTPRRIG
jgi:hypothetical protein